MLIGAGTNGTYTFSAGSTGGSTVAGNNSLASQTITNPLGEYTHKLVTAEMPSHYHTYYKEISQNSYMGYAGGGAWTPGNPTAQNFNTGSAGSDYYHNNIQPYLVVYMYKRTA